MLASCGGGGAVQSNYKSGDVFCTLTANLSNGKVYEQTLEIIGNP